MSMSVEEAARLQEIAQGSGPEAREARRALGESVRLLIYKIAGRCRRARRVTAAEARDGVQQAFVAVQGKGVDQYDPSLGFRWSTYAGRVAYRAIVPRTEKPRSFSEVPFSVVDPYCVGDRYGPESGLLGREENPADEAVRAELVARVRRMVANLPQQQCEVLTLRFGLDGHGTATYREIGEIMGFSRERARQVAEMGMDSIRRLSGGESLL